MFLRKKDYLSLVTRVKAVERQQNLFEEITKSRFDRIHARIDNGEESHFANLKFIRSVSTRVSAIKPSLRKTFKFLSESDTADRASNTKQAKWIEENL